MKLSKHYRPYAFAFFMAGIMAFLMSMVIVAANTGMSIGYVQRVLQAYTLAMPVAFVCVLIVRPIVVKLVTLVVKPN
jgi:hypothetical protein